MSDSRGSFEEERQPAGRSFVMPAPYIPVLAFLLPVLYLIPVPLPAGAIRSLTAKIISQGESGTTERGIPFS